MHFNTFSKPITNTKILDITPLYAPSLEGMNSGKNPQVIAKNIKDLRILLGYTQEYMALELGITQASYGRIENGKTKPSIDRLIEISKVLKIQLIDLLPKEDGGRNTKTIAEPKSIYSKAVDNPDTLYLKTLEKLVKHLEEQLKDKNEIILTLKNKDK